MAFRLKRPHNYDANDCEAYVHFLRLLDHETTLIRQKEKDLDLVLDKLRRPQLCLKDVFNRFIYSIWWRHTV